MSATPTLHSGGEVHEFRPCLPNESRSPCPALNTLANHGYISRDGKNLTFFQVVRAIVLVYNLSYPLALVLAFAGFITCGHISFWRPPLMPHWKRSSLLQWLSTTLLLPIMVTLYFLPKYVLDLSSLSRRGTFKIAHNAAFVHPDSVPSVAPDPTLLTDMLDYAASRRELNGTLRGGLGLIDIARFHERRIYLTPSPLSSIRLQISLGECALLWEVLRGHQCYAESKDHDRRACRLRDGIDGVLPIARLHQWLGEERLPDGWWGVEGVRPQHPVGIIKARLMANFIGSLASKRSQSKP